MRRLINVLAGVVLVLLLVLRRGFDVVFEEMERGSDRTHARRLRLLLAPAAVVLTVFLAVGTWALVDAGYPVVAILVLAHLTLVLRPVWRRPKIGHEN